MLRSRSVWSWLLSTLLLSNFLLQVFAQNTSGERNTTTSETDTTTAEMTTTSPPLTTPTPHTTANSTISPPPKCDSSSTVYVAMTAVFGALFFIALVLSCILLFVIYHLCSKRGETVIKKYVFEEGVQPPELWVDTNIADEKPVEHQPDVWEVSTFNPSSPGPSSPSSRYNSMPLANGTACPVPVQQPVIEQKKSKLRPKRVAPPPPKRKRKRSFWRTKPLEEASYAVPAPYLKPISHKTKSGYDVPKTQHAYAGIDVAKLNQPNAYAGLVVRQGKN